MLVKELSVINLDLMSEQRKPMKGFKERTVGKEGEKGHINEDALAGSPSLVKQFFSRLSQARREMMP